MDATTVLQNSLNNLLYKYQEATENPKPTYSIDEKSVNWGDYLAMLAESIKSTTDLLNRFQPVEIRSSIL